MRCVFTHVVLEPHPPRVEITGNEGGYTITVMDWERQPASVTVSRQVAAELYRALLRDLMHQEAEESRRNGNGK